jgi:hypothetical protein
MLSGPNIGGLCMMHRAIAKVSVVISSLSINPKNHFYGNWPITFPATPQSKNCLESGQRHWHNARLIL